MKTDELYHHGVKGQKWGVRRYQNYDGTLTQEGYQHYGLNSDGSRNKAMKGSPPNTSKIRKRVGRIAGIAGTVGSAAAITAASGGAFPVGQLAITAGAKVLTSGALSYFGGSVVGQIAGSVSTKKGQAKIRQLLNTTGTVKVNELK